jgi:hypothetical protein
MIAYDLKCGRAHVFEAWFGSSADYETQRARGLIACPLCDNGQIEKAAMAPAIARTDRPVPAGDADRAQMERLMAWQRAVEAQCDDVGRRFAAEARARAELPEQEQPARGLIGEATVEEAIELWRDGIAVSPLPLPRRKADA